MTEQLKGIRHVIERGSERYPSSFDQLADPPENLYLIGDPSALEEGLAVIGARKATPYGKTCARKFAALAAQRGIPIISGGARGCDSESHRAALEAGGVTVAFLGGGCDRIYPADHFGLFQQIINRGGAVVSERPWSFNPRPYTFRLRNRLIAALAKAVLIVEAGLPSGTFSTADEALTLGKDVLVVPGAITSESSHGSNRLLYQGATPVVDEETFEDVLFRCFGLLKQERASLDKLDARFDRNQALLLEALRASPMDLENLNKYAEEICAGARERGPSYVRAWLMESLVEFEAAGYIARQLDGKWGPRVQQA